MSSSEPSQMSLRKGSTCALITPFTPSGKIDVRGLENLLDFHSEKGTDNLCVLGTTAEAAVMSMEERELVLKTAVNKVKGKIPLLVGTGAIDPNAVKAMTQQAIDLGADASLLVSPYYVKPPARGLIRHFTEMAGLGLPLMLYNVPGRAVVDLSDETIATLAEHDSIIGVKDATGDLSRVPSLKLALGENTEFLLYSGDDGTTKEFVLQGGDGCISVTANIAPDIMHNMVQAALRGDEAEATRLNDLVHELNEKLFIESNPIPCKWAAKRAGLIDSAYCRPPLDEMDPRFVGVVEEALKLAGLI
jgi:4-hydroxy-tetrahydrodipicolinate synthase